MSNPAAQPLPSRVRRPAGHASRSRPQPSQKRSPGKARWQHRKMRRASPGLSGPATHLPHRSHSQCWRPFLFFCECVFVLFFCFLLFEFNVFFAVLATGTRHRSHPRHKSPHRSILRLRPVGIPRPNAAAEAPSSNLQKKLPLSTKPRKPPLAPAVCSSERWQIRHHG